MDQIGIEIQNNNTIFRPILGDESISLITGHSDISMVNHYDHPTVNDLSKRVVGYQPVINREWSAIMNQ